MMILKMVGAATLMVPSILAAAIMTLKSIVVEHMRTKEEMLLSLGTTLVYCLLSYNPSRCIRFQ